MKVKCIANKLKKDIHSDKLVDWAKNSKLEITVGKNYTVLAISQLLDTIFIYILSDESNEYPLAFPSELFEIVDAKVSKHWDFGFDKINSFSGLIMENNDIISFKEWALNKDTFYEKLLEGNSSELITFNFYKNKILNE